MIRGRLARGGGGGRGCEVSKYCVKIINLMLKLYQAKVHLICLLFVGLRCFRPASWLSLLSTGVVVRLTVLISPLDKMVAIW